MAKLSANGWDTVRRHGSKGGTKIVLQRRERRRGGPVWRVLVNTGTGYREIYTTEDEEAAWRVYRKIVG